MRRLIGAAVLSLAMVGQAGADGEKVVVSKDAWAGYQEYLGQIGSTKGGAFAVTKDGTGWGSSYCEEMRCTPETKKVALKVCAKYNPGNNCIVFGFGRDILVEYEVAQ